MTLPKAADKIGVVYWDLYDFGEYIMEKVVNQGIKDVKWHIIFLEI